MNSQEINKILEVSQGKKYEYDTSKTWIDLFREQAVKNPDKIAVVNKNTTMTYKELDEASDKIAAYLINNGVKVNEFVAVKMGRVKEFMSVVIGIQKAGAAYVPIDLDYPEARAEYILKNSEAKIIFTNEIAAEVLKMPLKITHAEYRLSHENLAYMIYTSGSTGNPKGVMIQHKALLNLVHFIRERWHMNEQSRISCHSSFAFDGSIEDLYPVLTAGGTLFIVPEEIRHDIFEMRNFIEKNKITGGYFTTLFAQILAAGKEPLNVDYISVGGEAMTENLNVSGTVYDTYGPTEFTVDATYFELEKGKEYNPIPIGRPLYNCAAFIVEKNNELLPIGETGELCLSGPQLALGYWKLPELTDEKFTALKISDGDVRKIYHTGDLARYNKDGQLEFLGRIDFQVKLRGFRIELGEIESSALKYPGIIQAAAAVRKKILCLYYTSEKVIDEKKLKSFMASSLADYMIPALFIKLERMPETPNGKLDRKALPDPDIIRKNKYVKPRNEIEKTVADCIKKALNINFNIGAEDNFIEIGGDSISAIQTVSFLREMGYSLKTNDILKYETVEKIAQVCRKISTKPQKIQPTSNSSITEWSKEEFNAITEKFAKRGEHLQRIYPILPSIYQELLFLLSQTNNPDELYKYDEYRIVEIYGLDFLPSENELRSALDALAKKHEVLRTAIIYKEVSMIQQAITDRKIPLTMTDISAKPDKLSTLKKMRKDLLKDGFDFEDKPLFQVVCAKTSENSCYIMIAVHHVIIDGWCTSIYMKDFEYFLQEARKPGGLSLSEVPSSNNGIYEQCVREMLEKVRNRRNQAVQYFKKLLESYNNKAEIPYDLTISENEIFSDDADLLEKIIDPQTVLNFNLICREFGVTLADGFSMIFGMVLQTVCNINDVVFQKVMSGRSNFSIDVSNVVCCLVSPVLVRVKAEKDTKASSLLKSIHKQFIESNEFDFIAADDIQEELGFEESYWKLSFENYDYGDNYLSILKPILVREELSEINMIYAIPLSDGSLKVIFMFDTSHYRRQKIEHLFCLIEKFMKEITKNPDVKVNLLTQNNE